MQFLNPTTDYAFKKIFGSPESADILLSFLNSVRDVERRVPARPLVKFGMEITHGRRQHTP